MSRLYNELYSSVPPTLDEYVPLSPGEVLEEQIFDHLQEEAAYEMELRDSEKDYVYDLILSQYEEV